MWFYRLRILSACGVWYLRGLAHQTLSSLNCIWTEIWQWGEQRAPWGSFPSFLCAFLLCYICGINQALQGDPFQLLTASRVLCAGGCFTLSSSGRGSKGAKVRGGSVGLMSHHSRKEGLVRAYLEAIYTLGFHLRQRYGWEWYRHRTEDGEGKDGAYQELFPRGRDPWQCIRVWPLLFKVAES